MASQISRFSGGLTIINNKWLSRFFTRYSDIHLKLDKSINALRIQAISPVDLYAWYSLF
jgi:hypothetical protein